MIGNVFICMFCIIKLLYYLDINICKNIIYIYIGKNIIVILFFNYWFIILEKYFLSFNVYFNEFN